MKEDEQMMRLKKWSECQETLLADLANRCQSRSVMHHNEWRRYYRWNSLVSIPSIILTMLCGAASTSQNSLIGLIGPGSSQYVPLVIGLLSMFVSILNSISSFLKIPALTENHLQAHQSFAKLQRGIAAEIQVAPQDRSQSGKEAIKKYEELFVALLDIAPPVSKRTELNFSKRPDISSVITSVPPSIKIIPVRTYHENERLRKQNLIDAQKEVERELLKQDKKVQIEMAKQDRKLARTRSKVGIILRPPQQQVLREDNKDNKYNKDNKVNNNNTTVKPATINNQKPSKVRRQKRGGRTKEIKKELIELQKNDRVRSMSLKLMNDENDDENDETSSEGTTSSSSSGGVESKEDANESKNESKNERDDERDDEEGMDSGLNLV